MSTHPAVAVGGIAAGALVRFVVLFVVGLDPKVLWTALYGALMFAFGAGYGIWRGNR